MKSVWRVVPLLVLSVFLMAAGTGTGGDGTVVTTPPAAGDTASSGWWANLTSATLKPFQPAIDFFKAIGEAMNLLGNFGKLLATVFSWVGLPASILVVVTLALVWAVNLVSPLSKTVNYLFVVVLMLALAGYNATNYEYIAKFAAVMFAPFVLAYAFALIWKGAKRLLPYNSRMARGRRINDLMIRLRAELSDVV